MTDFASLCILSFNRRESLTKCVETILQDQSFPKEIIIHDDASTDGSRELIQSWMDQGKISYTLLNGGKNMGVGHAFNMASNAAHGKYIFKIDQDLVFKGGWLKELVDILDCKKVGAVGAFHYAHDPVDSHKMFKHKVIKDDTVKKTFESHKDFVGSLIGFRREIIDEVGRWDSFSKAYAEDYVWKMKLIDKGYMLALPEKDVATNTGFGIGPSTVVEMGEDGNPRPTTFSTDPLIK